MKRKGRNLLGIITTGFFVVLAVSTVGGASVEESESAECIACHTDLDAMDSYGADAAKGGAGIAG